MDLANPLDAAESEFADEEKLQHKVGDKLTQVLAQVRLR